MNVQDEDDFVFVCLFGAYVQSLLQRSWGQMDRIEEGLPFQAALAPRPELLQHDRALIFFFAGMTFSHDVFL